MAAAPINLPGAEFLQRRLARAAAIPAAERPPDVAAFVESVHLLRQACELLPLTAAGSPVLPAGCRAASQQVQLAFLKAARAHYISPCTSVCDKDVTRHLHAYCLSWESETQQRRARQQRQQQRQQQHAQQKGELTAEAALEFVLQHFITSWLCRREADDAESASSAAEMLAHPTFRQAASWHLSQLAAIHTPGQPLLTVAQLEYLCCCCAAEAASGVQAMLRLQGLAEQAGVPLPDAARVEGLSSTRLLATAAAGQRCMDRMLQLEPGNPKSYTSAALAAHSTGQAQHAADLIIQGCRVAREQRSDWGMVHTARLALLFVSKPSGTQGGNQGGGISRSSIEAAVAAYQQTRQALPRCMKLLPQPWVEALELSFTDEHFQRITSRLMGRIQQEESSAQARSSLRQHMESLAKLGAPCDGCGQQSVGLRRCSRCRNAQYCSSECQHRHWRMHKRECQASA